MTKKNEIIVKDIVIKTITKDGIDYICITDIARQKNNIDPNGAIANWMRLLYYIRHFCFLRKVL